MRTSNAQVFSHLPSLRVILPEPLPEILVPAPVVPLVLRPQMHLLGVLLQVRHVVCRVASLEHRRRRLVLLLALPQQVEPQGRRELGGEHLAARCLRRQRCLVWCHVRRGHDDRLRARARHILSGTESVLHCQWRCVVVGVDRGRKRRTLRRGGARTVQCWCRHAGCILEGGGAVLLVEHGCDEGSSRRQVWSRVDARKGKLLVDAGLAALLHRILPIRRVVIVNRTLIDLILVISLENVVTHDLILVDRSSRDLLLK